DSPGAGALIGAAIVLAITYTAWHFRESRPWLAAGWGWYLATLIPVSGIVQSGAQGMADRFTYVPMMGLTAAAVWLCGTGSQPVTARADGLRTRPTLAVVALLAFSAVSVWYSGVWHDSITLFAHTKAVTDDNPLAHVLLGNALMKESRFDEANVEYDAAMKTSHNAPIPL